MSRIFVGDPEKVENFTSLTSIHKDGARISTYGPIFLAPPWPCPYPYKLDNAALILGNISHHGVKIFFFLQRITIPEIKMHPWFLKNLPVEFMEIEEGKFQFSDDKDYQTQSVDEILSIIQEARKPGEGPKFGIGGQFLGGSMDLDDVDIDADIDDIETSGDFVCAL